MRALKRESEERQRRETAKRDSEERQRRGKAKSEAMKKVKVVKEDVGMQKAEQDLCSFDWSKRLLGEVCSRERQRSYICHLGSIFLFCSTAAAQTLCR
jgi:hypothetical protein